MTAIKCIITRRTKHNSISLFPRILNEMTFSSSSHHQWKSHIHSHVPKQFTKTKDGSVLSNSLCAPFRLISFTKNFSSNYSKREGGGFIAWYLGKLDSNPLITKAITTSLIYVAADVTAQTMTSEKFGSIDWIRTLRMGGYGLLILGPSQHVWFNQISKVLPQCDIITTLKKIFLGQAVFGPANATVFFTYNAVLQGENGSEIMARLKRDVIPTLKMGLLYWPICDFATYKFVPVHLQPLVNSTCAYFWTIYLTYMASLEKAS